ncbi:MAG: hypothetical protein U0470_10885 [Anaerolineae bacterium]
MFEKHATTSGEASASKHLALNSPASGSRPRSASYVAATAMTFERQPGELRPFCEPPLPVATKTAMPRVTAVWIAVVRAWSVESQLPLKVSAVPRLMFAILTFRLRRSRTIQSNALIWSLEFDCAAALNTRTATIPAPGAMPLAATCPRLATMPATPVPCPLRSIASSLSEAAPFTPQLWAEKHFWATTASLRSGWVASMPVSMTATFTPSPVMP